MMKDLFGQLRGTNAWIPLVNKVSMRGSIWTTLLILLPCLAVSGYSATVFYDDVLVQEGDSYNDGVLLYDSPPNHSTLEMTGGNIYFVESHDQSTVNLKGGYILDFWSYDESTFNISGGLSDGAGSFAHERSTMNISGGEIFTLQSLDQAAIAVSGGNVLTLIAHGESTIDIQGGRIDFLGAKESSVINISCRDFLYDAGGGQSGGGLLTGTWQDGSQFSMDLIYYSNDDTFDHINIIPEPSTLFLFTLGALTLRRNRKS